MWTDEKAPSNGTDASLRRSSTRFSYDCCPLLDFDYLGAEPDALAAKSPRLSDQR